MLHRPRRTAVRVDDLNRLRPRRRRHGAHIRSHQPSLGTPASATHSPPGDGKTKEHRSTQATSPSSKLYKLVYDFIEANEGKFQIIAVDHADFDEPWFRDSIIEYWRGGDEKLIPAEWVEKHAKATKEHIVG